MINVDIRSDSRYPVDRKRIRNTVIETLEKENLDNVDVSVFVVGKRKMHDLNKSYRGLDYPTNVLSFCQYDQGLDDKGDFVQGGDEDVQFYLGDIVVCFPVAVEQSRESWLMVDDWIDTLVEHSVQHLLGRHHR